MKKITKLVLKSYLGPFISTFVIVLFILVMQFVWKYVDDFVGKGLEMKLLGELLAFAAVSFVPLALPLAILLSSIMTFGNLGERYELTALKSSGVSLQRIMRPLIITSAIISVLAFLFSNYVSPIANLKMGTLLFDIREQKPAFDLKEGVFYNGIDNYIIRVEKKEADGQTVKNIMIYDHRNRDGSTDVTMAQSGKLEMSEDKNTMHVSLYDGSQYKEIKSEDQKKSVYPFQRQRFKSMFIDIDMSGFNLSRSKEELFKDNYQMLNIKQLSAEIDTQIAKSAEIQNGFEKQIIKNMNFDSKFIVNKDTKNLTQLTHKKNFLNNFTKIEKLRILESATNISRSNKSYIESSINMLEGMQNSTNKYQIEWHKKIALSFACFLLFFIGAPLGAIIRKGGLGMPVVVSVLFFLLFHVLSISGEKMANEGALPVWQGVWLASGIILPIGIFLTYKATRDSSLFDFESYIAPIKKIFSKKNVHTS